MKLINAETVEKKIKNHKKLKVVFKNPDKEKAALFIEFKHGKLSRKFLIQAYQEKSKILILNTPQSFILSEKTGRGYQLGKKIEIKSEKERIEFEKFQQCFYEEMESLGKTIIGLIKEECLKRKEVKIRHLFGQYQADYEVESEDFLYKISLSDILK